MMLRRGLSLLTLAVVLMLAATGMAWADENRALDPGVDPNPRPSPSPSPTPRPALVTVAGVVQSVADEGFTMSNIVGKQVDILLNILVNVDTRFVILGDTDPGLQDLAEGDWAVVAGWPLAEDPNTITARVVTVRKVQPQPLRIAGLVSAVDVEDAWFQVAVSDLTRSHLAREIKVLVTAETEFVFPGVEEPGLDKLLVGDKVVVVGESVVAGAEVAGNQPEIAELTAKTVYVQRAQARPVRLLGVVAKRDYELGTFDLVAEDGVVKHVRATEDTEYSVPGVEEPTLADVKDGDMAQVVARLAPSTEALAEEAWYTAMSVAVRRPQPITLTGAIGQVDEAAGTFELVLADGAIKEIKTDADTRFKVPDVEVPTIADLETGQRAVVTAWRIAVLTPAATAADELVYELMAKLVVVQKPRPVNLNGAIEAVDVAGGSFSLALTSTGEIKQIFVDEQTTFTIPGLEEPGLAELEEQIGSKAVVKAISAADGTLWAQSVAVKPQTIRRGSVVGEVSAIAGVEGGTELTVQTVAGEKRVLVTEDTRVRPEGAEILVGSRIAAAGLWMEDGSLQALTIAVRGAALVPTLETEPDAKI